MKFLIAAQTATTQWPDTVVRDTLAAIMRQRGYERSLTESLWQRFSQWLERTIDHIHDYFVGSRDGRMVAYVVLAVIIVLIVARIVVSEQANGETKIAGGATRVRAANSDAWLEAERLAAIGNFTMAAHSLFAALLGSLAARGDVRLHPSKTTGDYARELRPRDSGAYRVFNAFRSRYDRVIYGMQECSADDYSALREVAQSLVQGKIA